jgi:uncharacterized membrane protein
MFFIGMLIAAIVAAIVIWVIKKGIKVTWYEWLLGAMSIILTLMTVQHYTGSLAEDQVTAAQLGSLIFGGIALVLYIVTIQFVWRHNRVRS